MKAIKLTTQSLLVAIAAWCAGSSSAHATPITWGAAHDFTGASDVLTPVPPYMPMQLALMWAHELSTA